MVVVKGEGPFADAVRRALEYAQSRGVDLSGVVVEVVPDPSITDFGAYAEPLGGLRFRIRYNPRYANDVVLASHEAGHVAYWTWQTKKRSGVQYVPDIDEPLAEAFGAVVARQVFGVPVTFKGAPLNLTKILPERTTHITVTVGGRPTPVKVPEWSDYMNRYRAGVFIAPYFYNVTRWDYVFGNFTTAPADVIETVHKAWREGAVEVVPGWGAVWRTTPTWNWPDTSLDKTLDIFNTSKPSDAPPANTPTATTTSRGGGTTQKNVTTVNSTTSQVGVQKAVVYAQPSADVPLPPSNVQPPRYFNSDIAPEYVEVPGWDSYISGRRVLVVFRNWPSLDTATLKETRKDHVAGVGVVSGGRLRFENRIPVPRVVDPNAWIEFVDEKTGKVLARLKSDELYKLSNEGAPVTLYWSHVATEEKWPGWERFVDRAKELDEKLGTWKPGTASISPDGMASAVAVANAPTEYVPPKVPDDVRRQFENLISELKKLGEGVNPKNVGVVQGKFIQLRDKVLDTARAYPQLIDEANETVGRVGSAIRDASNKLYDALAKAAGRDSFWRGDGDVKTPIGVYKYDPATGTFLLSLYDRPTAENIVGYIKDDGTPVVVKKTQNMSEAIEEYNKLLQKPQTAGGFIPPPVPTAQPKPTEQQSSQQTDFLQPLRDALTRAPVVGPLLQTAQLLLQTSGGSKTDAGSRSERTPVAQNQPTSTQPTAQPNGQRDFLWPMYSAVDFLVNALRTGAGITLTALGGAGPSSGSEQSSEQQFVTATQSGRRAVRNRRRGMLATSDTSASDSSHGESSSLGHSEFEFVQPPNRQQKAGEVAPARPPDYVLIEMKAKTEPSDSGSAQPSSGRQRQDESAPIRPARPPDYVLAEQETRRARAAQTGGNVRLTPPPNIEPVEASQAHSSSEAGWRRGRPVAVPI